MKITASIQKAYFKIVAHAIYTGLHKLKLFIHKILCMQNCFRCTSVHVGNCACKRADVQGTNNNMIRQ